MKTEKKYLYADFGNTRAKFLMPGDKVTYIEYDKKFEKNISVVAKKFETLYFSSVNDKATVRINNALQNVHQIDAKILLKKQNQIDYSNIKGIGTDRLLGLIGGLSLSKPPVITVDFGTAVTINVLGRNRMVLGGIILPGPYLQEKSLKIGTDKLRKFEFKLPEFILGKTTSEAISSGIFHEIAFGVKGVISALIESEFKDEDVNIFFTGGGLSLILPLIDMKYPFFTDEILVLRGLKYLVEHDKR